MFPSKVLEQVAKATGARDEDTLTVSETASTEGAPGGLDVPGT